jgi:diguanylate cyclase (GGDEF)-like protein/PAS domain S-box-containing protein
MTEPALATALAQANCATLRAVIDGMPDAVLVVGRDRQFIVINNAARLLFGDALGSRLDERWPETLHAYAADGSRLLDPNECALTRALAGELVDAFRILLRGPHRSESLYLSATSRPIRDESGAITASLAVFRDVTETRRVERARQHSEERFRRLSEATFEGITLTVDGIVLDSNETFARMFGYEPEEVLGRDATDFATQAGGVAVTAHSEAESTETYEAMGLRKDGTELPVELRGRMVEVDNIRLRITAIRDITERKRTEAKLAEQAEALRAMAIHDELTGLYNRRGFQELGGQQLRLADREDRPMALVFADVNGLKQINDQLGHEQGDQVIRDAARVLSRVARSADLVARLGGDELVVLASGLTAENVPTFDARLAAAIDEHNATAGRPYALSMSFGVSYRTPRSPRALEELVAEADQLMYVQKRERRLARGAAA